MKITASVGMALRNGTHPLIDSVARYDKHGLCILIHT